MTYSFPFIVLYLAAAVPVSGFTPIRPIVRVDAPSLLSRQIAPRTRLFQNANPQQQDSPLDVTWPDFDKVFHRIEQASPLARSVLQGENQNRGLAAVEGEEEKVKWHKVESHVRHTLHSIERIDNYDGLKVPMLRFRASLSGPCVVELEDGVTKINTGLYFTRYIVDDATRKRWDTQTKDVFEFYNVQDLEFANEVLGLGQFGHCSHLGLGYCETKSSFGIGAREQMFAYGVQDFADGSCIVFGTELDENNNHLLPQDRKRLVRSKNHLFAVTVTPKTKDTFDVEYVVQMEIGGGLPLFLTTPVLINLIKRLFASIEKEFSEGEGGPLGKYLEQRATEARALMGTVQ